MQTRFEANRKFWPEASLSQVHRLIANYADINQPDEEGWTPVQWAARWGDFEIMHALLAAGADATRFDRNGRNALHLAVRWGNLQDREHWPEFHKLMVDHLERFDAVFRPRVKEIDPSEWVEPDKDEET